MQLTVLQTGEDVYYVDRLNGTAKLIGKIEEFRPGYMGGTCYHDEPGVLVKRLNGERAWYQRRQVENYTNVVVIGFHIMAAGEL